MFVPLTVMFFSAQKMENEHNALVLPLVVCPRGWTSALCSFFIFCALKSIIVSGTNILMSHILGSNGVKQLNVKRLHLKSI